MNIFSVSFFGHRQIDNPLQIESQLEEIISSLLKREEYIEFLVGRDGEFDQLVSSTIWERSICVATIKACFPFVQRIAVSYPTWLASSGVISPGLNDWRI